jgi:hypothetical protein
MDLNSLIPMLRSNGVTRFEGYGVKVELSPPSASGRVVDTLAAGLSSSAPNDAASGSIPGQPEPTMDLPGTNDAMAYDQILNWSASPDASEQPVAGTGDQPLTGGE